MNRPGKTLNKKIYGFTIIETMIVLAIASFIMLLAFVGVSTVQAARRDNDRIAYSRRIYNTLNEYVKNNSKFPSCSAALAKCTMANTNEEAKRVLTLYVPENISDPSTGELYVTGSASDCGAGSVCSGNTEFVYENTAVNHSKVPAVGELLIYSGHWCHTGEFDGEDGGLPEGVPSNNPVTNGLDDSNHSNFDRFAVLIGTERGRLFCVDNFTRNKGVKF